MIVAGRTNLYLDASEPASNGGQDGRIWAKFLKAAGLTDACDATRCGDDSPIDRVAYRSGSGADLDATAVTVRADRFVDRDGRPLSDGPPVEVAFGWKPA